MQRENATYYNITVTTADGKVDKREFISEKQYNEAQTDAAKVQSTVTVDKVQTFAISQAESVDEILTVTPNTEVALSYYNYGLSLAQHNVKRDLMKDSDWPAQEGVYDLLADVQQPKEKRVADPLSSSRRALKALYAKMHPGQEPPTDDEINAVLASFAGASAQPTAA